MRDVRIVDGAVVTQPDAYTIATRAAFAEDRAEARRTILRQGFVDALVSTQVCDRAEAERRATAFYRSRS